MNHEPYCVLEYFYIMWHVRLFYYYYYTKASINLLEELVYTLCSCSPNKKKGFLRNIFIPQ